MHNGSAVRVTMRAAGLVLLAMAAAASLARAQDPPVFGGFDASRGGEYSLRDGSQVTRLRQALVANYPDATFTATSTLTADHLSTVTVVFLDSVASAFGQIAPLTTDEQAALLNFVRSGGHAIIITDNRDFDAANQSLLQPFGLHAQCCDQLPGLRRATVPDPASHPVTNGPFGLIDALTYDWPGWYDQLGDSAVALAGLDDANGLPALVVIDPGVLGDGSGGVVLLSDSDAMPMEDGFARNLVLNALAYLAQS